MRPMLAGLLLGIVHDRRLRREAQVNNGNCWFAGGEISPASGTEPARRLILICRIEKSRHYL